MARRFTPRLRTAGLLAAGALVGAVLAGGIAIAADVSAGTGHALCLPASGAITVPVSGSCGRGYTRITVADEGTVRALATRLNQDNRFLVAKYPPKIQTNVTSDPQGRGYDLGVLAQNLQPSSAVTVVITTTTNGTAAATTKTISVGANGDTPVTYYVLQCQSGQTISATASGTDFTGSRRSSTAHVC